MGQDKLVKTGSNNWIYKYKVGNEMEDRLLSINPLKSIRNSLTLGTVAYSPVLYIYTTDTYNFYFYR